jgi:hypothetical protein
MAGDLGDGWGPGRISQSLPQKSANDNQVACTNIPKIVFADYNSMPPLDHLEQSLLDVHDDNTPATNEYNVVARP